MNYSTIKPWTPYYNDDSSMAGYVTHFNYNFSFATIRLAGHMTPQTQPISSYKMGAWTAGASAAVGGGGTCVLGASDGAAAPCGAGHPTLTTLPALPPHPSFTAAHTHITGGKWTEESD
jgi:hypothetical protein